MNPVDQFNQEKKERVESYASDKEFKQVSYQWLIESFKKKY